MYWTDTAVSFHNADGLTPERLFGILSWTLTPRPIAWVTSRDDTGARNLAPFSFVTVASTVPPMLAIAIEPKSDGSRKDTLTNILTTREFVVHIAPSALVDDVATSSEETPQDFDEITALGLGTDQASLVNAPLLSGCIAAYECVLHESIRPGLETLIIGKVVGVHLAPEIVNGDGRVIPERLDPLARVGTTFAHITLIDTPS